MSDALLTRAGRATAGGTETRWGTRVRGVVDLIA